MRPRLLRRSYRVKEFRGGYSVCRFLKGCDIAGFASEAEAVGDACQVGKHHAGAGEILGAPAGKRARKLKHEVGSAFYRRRRAGIFRVYRKGSALDDASAHYCDDPCVVSLDLPDLFKLDKVPVVKRVVFAYYGCDFRHFLRFPFRLFVRAARKCAKSGVFTLFRSNIAVREKNNSSNPL